MHELLTHRRGGDRNGLRHRVTICTAVTFYHDVLEPHHDRAVVAARIERTRDALEHRARCQTRKFARQVGRELALQSITDETSNAFHGLERDVACETISHDDIDFAGENILALDEADVLERDSQIFE